MNCPGTGVPRLPTRSICHACGRLTDRQDATGLCARCRTDIMRSVSPQPAGTLSDGSPIVAGLLYEGATVELIEAVKLSGHHRPLRYLARAVLNPMIDHLRGSGVLIGGPDDLVLVPVPASRRGRRHRGFDQAHILCRESGFRWTNVLHRTGGGQQKTLALAARAEHTRATLSLRGRPPVGELVVVDDVVTTGATVRYAAELCHHAGNPPRAAVALCTVP